MFKAILGRSSLGFYPNGLFLGTKQLTLPQKTTVVFGTRCHISLAICVISEMTALKSTWNSTSQKPPVGDLSAENTKTEISNVQFTDHTFSQAKSRASKVNLTISLILTAISSAKTFDQNAGGSVFQHTVVGVRCSPSTTFAQDRRRYGI